MPAPLSFENMVSAPGVPSHAEQPMPSQPMKGGRWGSFPDMGALNPDNGVGLSGGVPFGRVACEGAIHNPLNPTTQLHMATTAITGGRRVRGGNLQGAPVGAGFSSSNFPVVHVGSSGSMAYNAPTAGYANDFEALPSGSAVPGFSVQTPYDARGDNMACAKTGGSRRRRAKRSRRSKRGGAYHLPPAELLAPYTIDQVGNRADFDGSQSGLPVKFGGRRTRRGRKSHKHHKGCKCKK